MQFRGNKKTENAKQTDHRKRSFADFTEIRRISVKWRKIFSD